MELHFLEVPKFQKKPVSEMTSVERWLAYFSNKLDINEMEKGWSSDEAMDVLSITPEERAIISARL